MKCLTHHLCGQVLRTALRFFVSVMQEKRKVLQKSLFMPAAIGWIDVQPFAITTFCGWEIQCCFLNMIKNNTFKTMSSIIIKQWNTECIPNKIVYKGAYFHPSHLTASWKFCCFTSYLWDLSYFIHALITIFHRTGTYWKLKKFFFVWCIFFSPRLGSQLLFGMLCFSFCFL